MAEREQSSRPVVLLMAGFAGAGKSTLAQWLSCNLNWTVLDKDEYQRSFLATGMEKNLAGWNAFETLFKQLEICLSERQSVIIDTSNEIPFVFERARRVFKDMNADYMILFCLANEQTRRQRLEKRGSSFVPYYQKLPDILPDSELPSRLGHLLLETHFQHLLDPDLFKYSPSPLRKDSFLFIDTNQPLETYADAVLSEVQMFYNTVLAQNETIQSIL